MLNLLRQLKVFLVASLILGISDVLLTHIALGYGFSEWSPLHNYLGETSILSDALALVVIPVIIILGSLKLGRKLFPHILVLIQLLNVTASVLVIALLKTGHLLLTK